MFNITINQDGHILLPLEIKEKLNLRHNDWFKASFKSEHIVLMHSKSEVDEELIEALIHEGVLIQAIS